MLGDVARFDRKQLHGICIPNRHNVCAKSKFYLQILLHYKNRCFYIYKYCVGKRNTGNLSPEVYCKCCSYFQNKVMLCVAFTTALFTTFPLQSYRLAGSGGRCRRILSCSGSRSQWNSRCNVRSDCTAAGSDRTSLYYQLSNGSLQERHGKTAHK